jgi:N-acetylmuramoyl-L-alanine amidase
MVDYIFYTIISLGCTFALYFFLLKNQKTFQFNRFFLIISVSLCLISPLLEFNTFEAVPSLTEISFHASEEDIISETIIENVTVAEIEHSNYTVLDIIWFLYLGISVCFLFRFFKNLFGIIKLINQTHKRIGNLKIIEVDARENTSSFFNYIFVSSESLNDKNYSKSIIKHELIHSEEWHTLDVIFVELLLCIFWFNPFIWLYKRAIVQNHEFIADHATVQSGINLEDYSQSIIKSGYKEYRVPLTSGFNFIQIKKRIIMLHQSKTSVFNRALKISTVILLFAGIFVFSSCKEDIEDSLIEDSLIVVIDAGHGGKDSGELSGRSKEKDIVLNISNQLSLLSNTKIQLIMTRQDDTFTSLEERVNFINAQNADLVISLHCNAHKDESFNGIEAYYYDKSSFKDRSYKYSNILLENQKELFSNNRGLKTANMYVLKHINSPGVILELGFMTNKNDKTILVNTENQKEIARSIFEGLKEIRALNLEK